MYNLINASMVLLLSMLQEHAIAESGHPWLELDTSSLLVIEEIQNSIEAVHFDITDHLKVLYDTSGTYQISNLIRKRSAFTSLDDSLIDQVSGKVKVFWLALDIENHSESERWYLGLHHRDIEFFILDKSSIISEGVTGTHRKIISGINWLTPMPFIPLDLQKGKRYQIILRVTPKLITTVGHRSFDDLDRTIVNLTFLYQYRSDLRWQIFSAIGVLVTIFIYHFILFLYNREITYLYLSLFSLFILFAKILYNGLLFTSLELDSYGFLNDVLILAIYAFGAIAFRFTSSYLQISKSSLHGRAIRFLEATWILSFVSVLILVLVSEATFITYQGFIGKFLFVQTLLQQPFLLLVGLICLIAGNKNAIYYLLGLSIWFSIHFLNILQAHNIADVSPAFPRDILTAFSMILFSFGLARQFRILQVERMAADKKRLLSDQLRQLDQKEANRLKELDQFKSQLYTNITHEFRTPLTVISGVADQLDDHSEKKILIQRNADQLLDLVNQMLDLNKLDAGQLKPKLLQLDLVTQLKYLCETYHQLAKAQDKIVKLDLLEDELWLDIDSNFVDRIMTNLVHNAIKFSPLKGVVKIRLEKIDQRAIITVVDQGPGIANSEQDKIFDRFYRVDASATCDGQGSGIGLALAKELCTLLHGDLSVKSEIGSGSSFVLSIPITNSMPIKNSDCLHTRTLRRSFSAATLEEKTKHSPTILIIEDHYDVRRYLSSLLASTYQVREALNGRSGLSLAYEQIPDLIISDVMMPEMDGFQLCEKIKADVRTSHIPVILLTAKSTQADRLIGLREGADAYLVKPFLKEELFVRIEKLLESREKLRKHYQRFETLPLEQVEENRFLKEIRDHLEANLNNENHQIENLASAMHVGRVQLFRKLKALTGKSYTQLLREIRIHRAKQLLTRTDLTISEIAQEVGYRDGSYFSKVFKKEVGVSAVKFRSG